MIMWIAAIVLVALTVSLGYRQGATRAAILFVGLITALLLAPTTAPMFNFVFKFIKVHPVTAAFLKPVIAFLLITIVFIMIGAFVHRKIDYHYRYHVPDSVRAFWERMHRRVGAAIGTLNGGAYFFAFALFVYVAGYSLVQIGGDESGSTIASFITKSAQDMKDTGMDKVVAPFDPAPKKYHEVSDLLGLVYQNRSLRTRLYNYPVFASMAEQRPIFHDMGADAGLQGMIDRGAKLSELLENAKVQEVVTNVDLYNEFMEMDFADIRTYLETGSSPKFADEKILGRWAYDFHSTLQANKQGKKDIGAAEWSRLSKELEERMKDSQFRAFHDNVAILQLSPSMEGKASPMVARGLLRNRQTNFVATWLNPDPSFSSTGKWSGANPNYLVTLGNKNGSKTSQAQISNNRIAFKFEEKSLVYERIPD